MEETQQLQNTISKSTELSKAKDLTAKLKAEIARLRMEIRYLEGAVEGIRLMAGERNEG
jgi:hypothetical protein